MSTKAIILRKIIPVVLTGMLSYVPFSLSGEYKRSNYGGQDWRTQWHPRFMFEHKGNIAMWPPVRPKSRITILGVIYWPCILIDRTLWHPTEFMETVPEQLRKMQ